MEPRGGLQNQTSLGSMHEKKKRKKRYYVEVFQGVVKSLCSSGCWLSNRSDRRGGRKAQAGGRLKRQMKWQHIERREMWQWELVTGRGSRAWLNKGEEWIQSPKRRGKWPIWTEKGSNSFLHLVSKGAPRMKQSVLSCYWRERKGHGKQWCTMGVLRHLIGGAETSVPVEKSYDVGNELSSHAPEVRNTY